MSGHALHEIAAYWDTKNQKYVDPGSGGTVQQNGLAYGVLDVASGTRVLPDNGLPMYVRATGSVTITSAAAVTLATLASGQSAFFLPLTSTTWSATVQGTGTGAAAAVAIADAGTYTSTANVETALQQLYGRSEIQIPDITSITTVGDWTLMAAGIAGGVITRSGSVAAYTDTTATAAQIIAASPSNVDTASAYLSWYLLIKNTVAFAETLAAGSGVTLAGQRVVPPNSTGIFHVLITDPGSGTEAVTITGLGTMPECNIPNAQYVTTAAASGATPAAGDHSGARNCFYEVTTDGAWAQTTRSAAQLYGDIPNCHVGFTYLLTFVNRGNNTITLTGGSNVTITASENTIATLVTRTYLVKFTSSTACTWTSISKGTIET